MNVIEKEIAIKKYCEQNTTPIKKYCPEVNQRFKMSDGTVVWNNVTGKRTHLGDVKYDYLFLNTYVPVRAEYSGLYVKYIPELKAVEIARIYMKGGRGKDGETKNWSYTGKYDYYSRNNRRFIFNDDTNVYLSNGNHSWTNQKYANKSLIDFLTLMSRDICDSSKIESEMKKFNSSYNVGLKRYWTYPSLLKEWYRLRFMPRPKSKDTKEILSLNLRDDVPDFYDFEDAHKWYASYAWFEVINEKYAVIRSFKYNVKYNHGNTQIVPNSRKEYQRIFISESGKPLILWNIDGEWVRRSKTNYGWYGMSIINVDKIDSWKPLSYIKDLIDIGKNQINSITTILRHPIIETLYKSGYKHIAKLLLSNGNVASNLKYYFGMPTEGKGSLYKVMGANKYQLSKYENRLKENYGSMYYYRRVQTIKDIKTLYDMTDISSLSNETIDLVFDSLSSDRDVLREIFNRRGMFIYDEETPITEDQRKFFLKLCRMNRNSDTTDVVRLYVDIKRIDNSIQGNHGIDIENFHSVEDLMRIHDSLVVIQNRERLEREARYNREKALELEKQQKKFGELQEERIKKYECEDDEFCIRMPKHLNDLVIEGQKLHHCVASYVNSHAIGNTDIIFLRRKSAENEPFYTIEISNGRVVQIHGSCNRWLGNDPEAIPFVYEWLEKLNVSYDKQLLLNLGTGYGASSKNLPESYLFRKSVA